MSMATLATKPLTEDLLPNKSIKPVKWWAAFGALVLVLIAYSVSRWLLGGHAKPTPIGSTPVPTFMVVSVRIHEVVFSLIAVVAFYVTIVRPWRRERRFTADGVLFVSLLSVWWFTDPIGNYGRIMYLYNGASVNLGCPQCYLPGWQARMGSYVEPIIWGQAFYIGVFVLVTIAGTKLLGWYRRRWPQHGRIVAVLFVLAVATVFDLFCEIYWLKLGLYVYPNLPFSLFSDHYYRVPLHEILGTGLWYTGIVACRYFTNDKGETWAERGLSEVRVSPRWRSVLRVLACIGMYNASILLTYMIPMGLHAWTTSDAWPKDVYQRSYLVHDICGPDTTYACLDPRIAIPVNPGSAHISPDGKLIAPNGLPVQTRGG
jgi:hypothetical protein